ncbi:MAG: BamA/TamA family outer membrane protein [Methylococcales bacterium]|nr:BamA/TamA family outer membrane protein [Methylococcales bacterium]
MKTRHKNRLPVLSSHNVFGAHSVSIITALASCCITTVAMSAPNFSAVSNAISSQGLQSPNAVIVNNPSNPSQKPLNTPDYRPHKSNDGFVLPPAPKALPAPEGGQVRLKTITFTGNTVFGNDELQEIARPFLNRSLTARDLEELRSRINTAYVDAGYINSGAIIFPQSAASGRLQIKIVEGNLTEVRLEGMGRLREDYVRDRLLIGAGSPLNFKNLQEKYQSLLNDPLIERLNGSLLPGKHSGDSILTVKVTRARPYQLYADADNYTTPVVGGYTGRIGGWVDNLSSFGERLDANFIVTGGSLGGDVGIDVPLNAYDTHATFRYSNSSYSLIEKPINQLDIKTAVVGYDGGLSQPVYRSSGIELKAGVNLSVRESNSTILGEPFSFTEGLPLGVGKTKVTALRLWQQYIQQGENNVFVARSTFNTGLNALGSTIQNDSLLPSSEFFSWLGQAQYSHRVMDNGAQVVLKGVVQQAADPLLPLERFTVGGVYSVRGYRENFYVRDNGFSSGLDFRYPLFGGEPKAEHSLFLIPFMDYGGAWNNPTQADLNPKKDYLHSVGLGFNWHYSHVNTEFFWAHDIAGIKAGGHNIQDDGIHFKVGLVAF